MGTDRRAVGRWAGASLGTEARLSLAELSGGSGRFPYGASRVRRRRRAGNEAAVGGGGRSPGSSVSAEGPAGPAARSPGGQVARPGSWGLARAGHLSGGTGQVKALAGQRL